MAELANLTPDYIHRNVRKDPSTECWVWLLKTKDGYGMTGVARSVTWMAHRLSYLLMKGSIPDGHQIDHLCGNRSCVNPDHLEPVTPLENTRRAPGSLSQINRAKTHCHQGHEFDEANTYIRNGYRSCRECNRAAAARYVARRAARRAS